MPGLPAPRRRAAAADDQTVVLDPEGTAITMLGGVEPLDDAWVEELDDDAIDLVDDEDEAFVDEDDAWDDADDEAPAVVAHAIEPAPRAPHRVGDRRPDPELDALITWFVDELCHAPSQPGGLGRVLAGRRGDTSRRTMPLGGRARR